MRKVFFIFLLSSIRIYGQSPAVDKVTFESAVDWLNTKLDYIYYDQNGHWWNNTFYMNEDKEVTIKQISSKTPQTANIKNKNYTIRKFKIEDINPFTIEIKEVAESTGRFVKGQLLEIRTFSEQRNIHKTINNRKATSTSFLHLSFPTALTDTLVNYPQLVKEKLLEAVISSTKVYYRNPEANKELIFKILTGEYESESGLKWQSEGVFDKVIQFNTSAAISYFGYDQKKELYYINSISSSGVNINYYRPKEDTKLELVNTSDASNVILFDTFNSFQLNGEWYYRQ